MSTGKWLQTFEGALCPRIHRQVVHKYFWMLDYEDRGALQSYETTADCLPVDIPDIFF